MRIPILLLVLLSCITASAATTNRLFLMWENVGYDTGVVFYVYSQTNVALPVSGWTVVTNIAYSEWTNSPPGKVEILTAAEYQRFFVVTASNLFGESDFSLPVSSRRLVPPAGLKIGASP